jgi:hypothetical protein
VRLIKIEQRSAGLRLLATSSTALAGAVYSAASPYTAHTYTAKHGSKMRLSEIRSAVSQTER